MQGDAASDSANNGPTHHPNLYFPDGGIILSAMNDQERVFLCVHRFILSHHSPIFQDMLALPFNAQINELYEEIPVVTMPDTYEDLVRLVTILYAPESLVLNHHDPDAAMEVRGLLTIATKYQIGSVTTRIVRHIQADWPTDLNEWHFHHAALLKMAEFSHTMSQWTHTEHYFPEPASAIRLATEFGINSVLPAAFYRLAISNPNVQWGDIQWGDDVDDHDQLSARWDILEKDDWRRYNLGKNSLVAKFGSLSFYNILSEQCKENKSYCTSANARLCDEHRNQWNARFAQQPDVIGQVTEILERAGEWGLCLACRANAESMLRDFLYTVWRDLPKMFQLEDSELS